VKWLHHVIDSVDIEGTNRMLVVCCHENDQRRTLNPKGVQDLEPIHVGHLHVKKDNVGSMSRHRLDCFTAISSFTDYLYLAVPLEHLAYPIARERLVINNQNFCLQLLLSFALCCLA